MRLLIFVIASALAASTQAALTVSVYYESLCPVSKQFITTQLYPAYEILSKYLEVEFIPFGNAIIDVDKDGNLEFSCQHGPEECYGNEIQGCAISVDPDHSIDFIDCAMASDDASDDAFLQACATSSNITWDSIKQCYSSGLGDKILISNGNITEALNPPLADLPGVAFNGVFNPDLSVLARENFFGIACTLLLNPKECLQ